MPELVEGGDDSGEDSPGRRRPPDKVEVLKLGLQPHKAGHGLRADALGRS